MGQDNFPQQIKFTIGVSNSLDRMHVNEIVMHSSMTTDDAQLTLMLHKNIFIKTTLYGVECIFFLSLPSCTFQPPPEWIMFYWATSLKVMSIDFVGKTSSKSLETVGLSLEKFLKDGPETAIQPPAACTSD